MTEKLFARACQNPTCRQMFGIEIGKDEATCPYCNTNHHIKWLPKLVVKHKQSPKSK